jgi:hypothetical protein
VLAALAQAVWSGLVVSSVECGIDGTVVCTLDDGTVVCVFDDGSVMCALDDTHFLLFFLDVDFVDMLRTVKVSAVAGDMI